VEISSSIKYANFIKSPHPTSVCGALALWWAQKANFPTFFLFLPTIKTITQEAQVLKALVLGEEERGQSQYQVMCFVTKFQKGDFISSDAMAKLRQVRNDGPPACKIESLRTSDVKGMKMQKEGTNLLWQLGLRGNGCWLFDQRMLMPCVKLTRVSFDSWCWLFNKKYSTHTVIHGQQWRGTSMGRIKSIPIWAGNFNQTERGIERDIE
jgi:hypothetical protein